MQVGLFQFCRALDAASDWVAFSRSAPTSAGIVPTDESDVGGRGSGTSVPSSWALAGVRLFFVVVESFVTLKSGAI